MPKNEKNSEEKFIQMLVKSSKKNGKQIKIP